MTLIGITIVAIMMFLRYVVQMNWLKAALSPTPRIKAIYHSSRRVTTFIGALLASVVIVNAWLLTKGEGEQYHSISVQEIQFHTLAVTHNPRSGVHACTMIFDPSLYVPIVCFAKEI
jgi:hypothetical protein